MAVKAILHLIVGIIFWPFAVPMGFLLGFLYTFFPAALINGFLKYGGYLVIPTFKNQSIQIDGINISYMDRPSEDETQPTLVFLHGITSQKLAWVPLIRFLPSSWRIIAIDLPGHGESGFSEDKNYSADGMTSLLYMFFKEIELKHFHMIGESLGSAFAGQFAAAYPEMIDSVTMLCPPILHRLKDGPCTPAMAVLDSDKDDVKNPLLPTTPQEFRSMLELVCHDTTGNNLLQDHMLDAVIAVQSRHYDNFKRVLFDFRHGGDTEQDIKNRITKSKHIPGLVLWGKQDQICDVAGAKIIKRLAPHSKVVVIDNCGHCISIERPKKCGHFIKQFIEKETHSSRLVSVSE